MKKLRSLHARRGASALEVAVTVPILLGFTLAVTDLGRLISNTNRASSAAAAAADLVSSTESFIDKPNPDTVTSAKDLGVVNIAAREVALPLDLFGDGTMIITVITNDGAGPYINWTRRWGRTDIASQVSLSRMNGIVLGKGEAAVFAEVAYKFHPYLLSAQLLGLNNDATYETVAVRRPRLSGPKLTAS